MMGEYMTLETAELRHKCKILKRENDDLNERIKQVFIYAYKHLPIEVYDELDKILRGVKE